MGRHLQILHRKIYKIRGLRVMLQRGLAEMYKMLTKIAL
ncbi:unknown [Odoribacter sp. CAG:788]|nr:unknown [Odoribacter sp. CAG:788]